MTLNVAVAGYGNLGKSLEQEILKDSSLKLTAIFSRRNLDNPLFVPYKNIEHAPKTDVVLFALGSHNDIAENLHYFKQFDTVDSFDTHAKLTNYKQHLATTKPKTISLCAVGWDPGILSVVRALGVMGGGTCATFWGKGISQGHSNALRSVNGVLDAVSVTVPLEHSQELFESGQKSTSEHKRLCFVACVEGEKQRIIQEILHIPNYFLGENVEIVFCTPAEVRKIKQDTQHCGEVIARGEGFLFKSKLNVNNTQFTAKIMLAYAKAIPQLKHDGYIGALDCFDIPLKYLAARTVL